MTKGFLSGFAKDILRRQDQFPSEDQSIENNQANAPDAAAF